MDCNRSEGGEHGTVNCPRIIQNCADDLLNKFFVVFVEEGVTFHIFGVLDLCAVIWFAVCVRLFLGFLGGKMTESFEGVGNVLEHGNMES